MKPTVERQIEACELISGYNLGIDPTHFTAAATTLRRYVALEAAVGEWKAAEAAREALIYAANVEPGDRRAAAQRMKEAEAALRSIHEGAKP